MALKNERKKNNKGSLHKKKTEIYWSFTNKGGGEYPPTNIFSAFSWRKLLLLKYDLYTQKHVKSE